jgi:molecular chaperone GrpE
VNDGDGVSRFPPNTEREREREVTTNDRREAGHPSSSERAVEQAEAEVAAAEAAVESDLSELEQLQGERAQLLDTLRRVQADFENYRKRVLREQTALVERATERLVEDLLPVLDSFDGALGSLGAADSPEVEKVRDGVVGIRTQLVSVLEKTGLERIEAADAAFDPNEHEAVLQDDGEGEPHVAEILRTGYRLKGRVLRPAMVRVTRAT